MDEIRADIARLIAATKILYPKLKNRLKVIFTSILLIPLWITLLLGSLSYYGFCFEKHRFISDEEMIHITITELLKSNREYAEQHHDPSILYPWHTVEQYLAAYPDCCTVSQFTDRIDIWLDKLFGNSAGYVVFEIPDKYDISGKRKSVLKITNCGQVIDPW